jgi:hypothetical protein
VTAPDRFAEFTVTVRGADGTRHIIMHGASVAEIADRAQATIGPDDVVVSVVMAQWPSGVHADARRALSMGATSVKVTHAAIRGHCPDCIATYARRDSTQRMCDEVADAVERAQTDNNTGV